MYKLQKFQRILKRKDFLIRTVRQYKAYCKSSIIILKKNHNITQMRIGLVVTKKIGNSVVRNLIKRRVKNIFRQLPMNKRSFSSTHLSSC